MKPSDETVERRRAVGGRVRAARERAGLTQDQLADRAKLRRGAYLSQIETGAVGAGPNVITRLADALGISEASLVTGEAQPVDVTAIERAAYSAGWQAAIREVNSYMATLTEPRDMPVGVVRHGRLPAASEAVEDARKQAGES